MRHLKFYGHSDDTFGEYGESKTDIDNCASLKPIQCIVDAHEYGRMMVIGQYCKASLDNGCWMIGVCKVEEDDIFPNWEFSLKESPTIPYSMELNIVVPTDCMELKWYSDGRFVYAYNLFSKAYAKKQELLKQGYAQNSCNVDTEEQLDYFLHDNHWKTGDTAYCYLCKDGIIKELEIIRSIRRSDDIFLYRELCENKNILLDGEQAYQADDSAEIFTKKDCYLVWFRKK